MRKSRTTPRGAAILLTILLTTTGLLADPHNCITNGGFADALGPAGDGLAWDYSSDFDVDRQDRGAPQGYTAALFEGLDYTASFGSLDDVSIVSLWQSFTVGADQPPTLELSFKYWLKNGEGLPETDYFYVFLNEGVNSAYESLSDVIFETSTSGMEPGGEDDGEIRRFRPLAHGATYTLVFSLVGEDEGIGATLHLDDVAVVPVPGALVLGSLGLSYAGWRLRRRRAG